MQDQAIIIANAKGTIELWSEGAVRLFGYAAADAVGQKLDLVVPHDLREHHWQGFHGAMRRGFANGEGVFFDAPVLCRTGETTTFRGQLHVLRNEARAAIGAMAIFTRPV
jgi:PAS domain S-box-containing protein